MKTVELHLFLTFSEDIETDEEIKEVAENVMEGILRQRNEAVLAPVFSDAVTKEISITSPFNDSLELNEEL